MILDTTLVASFERFGLASPIKNMDERVLNQKRAVWLNKDGAIAVRARRESEKAKAKEKQEEAARKKIMKNSVQSALNQVVTDGTAIVRIAGPPPEACVCGNGTCIAQLLLGGVNGASWIGCPACPLFFCPKKGCQSHLNKHANICVARSLV